MGRRTNTMNNVGNKDAADKLKNDAYNKKRRERWRLLPEWKKKEISEKRKRKRNANKDEINKKKKKRTISNCHQRKKGDTTHGRKVPHREVLRFTVGMQPTEKG